MSTELLIELPPSVADARQHFAQLCLQIAHQHNEIDIRSFFREVDWQSIENGNQASVAQYSSTPDQASPTLIVPGLSGDTVSAIVGPFMCARNEMAVRGYHTEVVWLNGRTGCDTNADTLQREVHKFADKHASKINIIGYSKGCTDVLHMLANHPDTHSHIKAVVSLGGIVAGSPLADTTPNWLRKIVQYFPLPTSTFGDGRAIQDLTCQFREQWLQQHTLPSTIRYASIAAVPTPDRVSRILRSPYRQLSRYSRYNDSQVVAQNTLLPVGEVLATVNADHWAIVLPFSKRWSALFTRWLIDQNRFPRTLLLQAIIDHLSQDAATS